MPFDAQRPPAAPADLKALQDVSDHSLPPLYTSLLKYTNGGEWSLGAAPYIFVMFEVNHVIGNLTGTDFCEVYPEYLPIGGDGMSEYIALDFSGGGPPRIVAIDASEADRSQAVYPVAETFEAFVRLIGISAEND